jgi:regulator of sigma E protease
MHEFLVSVLAFIVLVGLMVIVHEFGHFAVAKFFKVRVEAFSFGFGPRLFGFKYGDTDYKVCLLPLGGFVKMTGEMSEQNLETPVRYPGGQLANLPISSLAHKLEKGIGEASDEQPVHDGLPAYDPGAFTSHPRWQRMLIGLAGPFSNFILAFVLMVIYFGWINEVPAIEVKSTTVEWINPGSAAAQAGIEPGDIIQRFDSEDNPTWDKVYERANLNLNQVVPVTVDRDGKTLQLTMRMPAELKGDDVAGMLPQYLQGAIGVQEVQPGTPADKAGLRAGDTIQYRVYASCVYAGRARQADFAGSNAPWCHSAALGGSSCQARYFMEAGICHCADSVPHRAAGSEQSCNQIHRILCR